MAVVRIIPAQRFLGLPAPAHRPYAFYADAYSLHGRTVAECYRLVKGLSLPPRAGYWQKECRTPFAWATNSDDLDAPLVQYTSAADNAIQCEEYSQDSLERIEFIMLETDLFEAQKELDLFPATWSALSFIISDAERMGAASSGWEIPSTNYPSARIHALFRTIQEQRNGYLLAETRSKEELGLLDVTRLPDARHELGSYHYLSVDSLFTNEIVELFGISHRCWHGCGYLGWPGFPMCRFFLLRNQMAPCIRMTVMTGSERYHYNPAGI